MAYMTHTPAQGTHAIVIGGSIAGMLAARVLTDHFAQVTVIERDSLPESPEFRAGTPHGRHAHGLLVRGQQIMETFFPGLSTDLRAQGAIAVNMGSELAISVGGAPIQSFDSDLHATLCSRPLLEHAIYRRLSRLAQVQFLDQQRVVGLLSDNAKRRAIGVRLQVRDGEQAEVTELRADLVVDASGRMSRLPEWLAEQGYPTPDEITIDAQAGYSTRIYRRPARQYPWKVLYGMPQAPTHSRGCILMPMEGDRWMATLTGLNGDYPPTDAAGFMEFARSVPVPAFAEALAQAEPLGEPYGYRRVANRMRYYDLLPRYLDGVVALGDSVYALNPVYGQGMTVAALGAITLDASLHEQRRRHSTQGMDGLAQRFQKQLAKINAGPWQMATGQDLRWEATSGGQQIGVVNQLVQRYFDRVLLAMTKSSEVAARFTEVQNMLRSPAALFHPRIVWQVLR